MCVYIIYIYTFFITTNFQLSSKYEIITQKNKRTASLISLWGGKTRNRVNDLEKF